MKYGINVFNELKGCYNLVIFNNKNEAIDAYDLLDDLWNRPNIFLGEPRNENIEEFELSNDDIHFLQSIYDVVFDNCISCVEGVCVKDILNNDCMLEGFTYYNRGKSCDDIEVLFKAKSVSIPC